MKFIVPSTILALASTTAATADAWSMAGGPYFTTKQVYLTDPAAMMQRQRALANRFLDRHQKIMASPRYELVDNEEKFQLSVDVPGVKMDDIDVSLEDGYLTVSGQRLSSSDESRSTSKFSQTFSLDPAVDVDQFTANLDNGVLVVAAPKDIKRIEENIVRIPVIQGKSGPLEDNGEVEVKKAAKEESPETLDLDNASA
ncbi:unnamed protein product [Cylindrotheca closterium]|uniref:SHSP domain-containing protein n=1 Tax=Cylindrotheca closterium TaxID=2856 RepID=A0AAD2FQE9_9STRA|nr:unnamed protein product [Cylindrotheca closterium]